ncbi:hypothetical protein [Pseudoalteromonas ostreae]|uniref:hypothetical protein n=1 Tax=Pseudoalteromonas ostreae TaxID=2774154 RepID=UPI001B387263|nr:hypothetical protein [Pseudoalteromonas ostreae]
MSKPAALEGEVQAIPGTTPFTGADAGVWALVGQVMVKPHAKVTVGGKKTIYQAEASFQFNGTTPDKKPITGVAKITLAAKPSKLLQAANKVLVNSDELKDQFGNTLKVVASGKLTTA